MSDLLIWIAVYLERVVVLWDRNPVGVIIGVVVLSLVVIGLVGFPWSIVARFRRRGKRETLERIIQRDKIDPRTGEWTREAEQLRHTVD